MTTTSEIYICITEQDIQEFLEKQAIIGKDDKKFDKVIALFKDHLRNTVVHEEIMACLMRAVKSIKYNRNAYSVGAGVRHRGSIWLIEQMTKTDMLLSDILKPKRKEWLGLNTELEIIFDPKDPDYAEQITPDIQTD